MKFIRPVLQSGELLVLSAALLLAVGCAPELSFDKTKFAELERTAQDLKSAIAANDPCDVPGDLQQRLASGIEAVRHKAASREEQNVVIAYSQLLATYQDGLLLCRSRPQFSNFDFFPKGRIYVSQDLDPVVAKYNLATEKHLYKHTGQYMRTIDAKSILVIWESARVQIKGIDNMMNYN